MFAESSHPKSLQRALDIAEANGFDYRKWRCMYIKRNKVFGVVPLDGLLFDHGFCRAIWGEYEGVGKPGWQGHIAMMAMSKNRLKYLVNHLDDDYRG